MELLQYQAAFVESRADLTVLCGQRGSGRSFAAKEASKRFGTRLFGASPDRMHGYSQVPLAAPSAFRGATTIVFDDFDLIEWKCDVAQVLKEVSPARLYLTVEMRSPDANHHALTKALIQGASSVLILFAGTHENTFLPRLFAEHLYLGAFSR